MHSSKPVTGMARQSAALPDLQQLSQIPLLHGLTPEELEHVRSLLRRTVYPAGANIMSAGQPGESVFIIFDGSVKIHVEQPDGSDVVLAIRGAFELLGELSLIDGPDRTATVETLEPSTMLWMPRDTFQECLAAIPAMYANIVRILARRVRLANAHIQLLAAQDAFGRVARMLLALAQEYGRPADGDGVEIPFRITQSDLAGLVGVTRVRVNQVLSAFKQSGWISINKNFYITVHDQQALSRRSL